MNWQEQLKAMLANNPDLPAGEENDAAAEQSEEPASATAVQKTRLDIGIERKGRAGKTATLITGWEVDHEHLLEIASKLKKQLGVGGAARGGDILIQGDCREKVLKAITDMGFKARII